MNKMKRLVWTYLLTVTLTVIAGCCGVDVSYDSDTVKPVSFSAFIDRATRAEINSPENLALEGGFRVWGFAAEKSSPDWTKPNAIFNGVKVSSATGTYNSSDTTAWTYSPIKYWNRLSTYCFYAVAPYSPTLSTVTYSLSGNGNAKLFTIKNVKSDKAANSDDILLCRAGVKNVDGENPPANVDFTFNHIMAKVLVKIVKSSDLEANLTVNSLEVTGWNKANGDFVQTLTATPSTLSQSEWTFATTSSESGIAKFIGTGCKDTSVKLDEKSDSLLQDSYIMVPQSIGAGKLKFTVEYTLSYTAAANGGSAYSESFKAEGTISQAHNWGTDSKTTYTVTIAPKSIKLSGTSQSWTTGLNKSLDIK